MSEKSLMISEYSIKTWCIVSLKHMAKKKKKKKKKCAVSPHGLTVPQFQPDLVCKIQEDLIKTEGVMLIIRSKKKSNIRNQGDLPQK